MYEPHFVIARAPPPPLSSAHVRSASWLLQDCPAKFKNCVRALLTPACCVASPSRVANRVQRLTNRPLAPSRLCSSLLDVYPDLGPSASGYGPDAMNRGAYEYQQQSGGRAQSSSPGVDDGQQQQRQLPPDAQYGQPGVNAQGPYRHSPPPHMAHDRSYSQANSFNRAQPQQQQSTYGAQARPQSQYIMGGQQPGRGGSPSSPGPHARPMSYADPQTSYGGPAAGPAPAGQPRDSAFYASPAASRSHLNSSPAPSSNQGSTRAQAPPGAPAANRQTGPPTRQGSVSSQSTSRHQHPPPPPRAPSTIGGEPLHDLGRAVALLKSSKFYAEGESVSSLLSNILG